MNVNYNYLGGSRETNPQNNRKIAGTMPRSLVT